MRRPSISSSICALSEGDLLVFYTDALIEANDPSGRFLGEIGLQRIVAASPQNDLRKFGTAVLDGVRQFSGDRPAEDDVTLLALRFSASNRRLPGFAEKLNAYAKLIGLKSV